MSDMQKGLVSLQAGADVLFLLVGAVLVFAMHGGFAFLEAGTVRHKNQVNALCKILVDFAISTVAYFFVGYSIAYGIAFFVSAEALSGGAATASTRRADASSNSSSCCTFAAAVPAIVSGGIAERARFLPQCAATALIVGLFYPFFEGIVWNKNFGLQESFFKGLLGEEFHDFAGSIVVHAVGGWIGFSAVRLLGPRLGRYDRRPHRSAFRRPRSRGWRMGSWLLCIGWFGFNVMSAQSLQDRHGPRRHQLADGHVRRHHGGADRRRRRSGLHPQRRAGRPGGGVRRLRRHASHRLAARGRRCRRDLRLRVPDRQPDQWKLDDVLGVWPLHGLCGLWGGIACGIFGLKAFGGLGGVSFVSQLVGSLIGAAFGALRRLRHLWRRRCAAWPAG